MSLQNNSNNNKNSNLFKSGSSFNTNINTNENINHNNNIFLFKKSNQNQLFQQKGTSDFHQKELKSNLFESNNVQNSQKVVTQETALFKNNDQYNNINKNNPFFKSLDQNSIINKSSSAQKKDFIHPEFEKHQTSNVTSNSFMNNNNTHIFESVSINNNLIKINNIKNQKRAIYQNRGVQTQSESKKNENLNVNFPLFSDNNNTKGINPDIWHQYYNKRANPQDTQRNNAFKTQQHSQNHSFENRQNNKNSLFSNNNTSFGNINQSQNVFAQKNSNEKCISTYCLCEVFHPTPPKPLQMSFNFEITLPQNLNIGQFCGSNNINSLSQAQNVFNLGMKVFNCDQTNLYQGPIFVNGTNYYQNKYKIDFKHNFTQNFDGYRKKIKEEVIMKKIYNDECNTRNSRKVNLFNLDNNNSLFSQNQPNKRNEKKHQIFQEKKQFCEKSAFQKSKNDPIGKKQQVICDNTKIISKSTSEKINNTTEQKSQKQEQFKSQKEKKQQKQDNDEDQMFGYPSIFRVKQQNNNLQRFTNTNTQNVQKQQKSQNNLLFFGSNKITISKKADVKDNEGTQNNNMLFFGSNKMSTSFQNNQIQNKIQDDV